MSIVTLDYPLDDITIHAVFDFTPGCPETPDDPGAEDGYELTEATVNGVNVLPLVDYSGLYHPMVRKIQSNTQDDISDAAIDRAMSQAADDLRGTAF